jgi:aminoglycoside phosphotransferase (APT) family kinase protein
LAYQEHPPRIGHPTTIITKLPGLPLDTDRVSAEEERHIYGELGRIIQKMHQLRIAGFGRLTTDGERVVGRHPSWQAHVSRLPRARTVRYLLAHRLVADDEAEALAGTLDRLDEVRLDRAVFVHGDLHPGNVLVDRGRIAGIIDVEHGQAGDPRLEIAVASLWQTDRQRHAFAEGYGRLARDPWVGCYRAWVAAQRLAWRHKTGRFETAEHARQVLSRALQEPQPPPGRRG